MGMQRMAVDSRDITLDFTRKGPVSAQANQIIAFWSANAQDAEKFGRTFKKDPKGLLLRSLIGITLPTLLLELYYRDDEDYQNIPHWQKNLFWIIKAGGDPSTYFRNRPGRFSLVHVKDMSEDGSMADVGAGTIDFASLFALSEQAGIRHYIVEHDNPADPFESITASYRHLRRLEF